MPDKRNRKSFKETDVGRVVTAAKDAYVRGGKKILRKVWGNKGDESPLEGAVKTYEKAASKFKKGGKIRNMFTEQYD